MIRVLVEVALSGYTVIPAAPIGIDKRGPDPLSQGLQLVKKAGGELLGQTGKVGVYPQQLHIVRCRGRGDTLGVWHYDTFKSDSA